MIAFLCGLFYGALLHHAWEEDRREKLLKRYLDRGMDRLFQEIQGEECTCDECGGCACDSTTDTDVPCGSA